MQEYILDQISPFCFLTRVEKKQILTESKLQSYQCDQVIMTSYLPDSLNLYLLVEGSVAVLTNQNETISVIDAPSYFGERHIIFETQAAYDIKARCKTQCLVVSDDLIRELLANNDAFRLAMASSLADKHKVFEEYRTFISMITNKHLLNHSSFKPFINRYLAMPPLLHPQSHSTRLDSSALNYVMPRLPNNITKLNAIHFHEDMPEHLVTTQDKLRVSSTRAEKRYMYRISQGKILFILRDDKIDLVDIIAKLCMYLIEAKKIIKRLNLAPGVLKQLTELYFNHKNQCHREIDLPFSKQENKLIKQVFGKMYLKKLYEVYVQNCSISVTYDNPESRYIAIAPERWIHQVRSYLPRNHLPGIHIISSNRHSIINCLSPWVHQNKELILSAVSKRLRSKFSEENCIYPALRRYLTQNPDKVLERTEFDAQNGINIVDSEFITGIEANVIYLNKLSDTIDPLVNIPDSCRDDVIINIDYAFGKQAQSIMKQLLLMFGRQVKSISVFGKCGGFFGQRGDLIIPNSIIDYQNDRLTPIFNQSLKPDLFAPFIDKAHIQTGNMLTVASSVLQNKVLLNYYKNLWQVSGFEMEGIYYIMEVLNSMNAGLAHLDVKQMYAYYISDFPMNVGQNLSSSMSEVSGIPAVYNLTRVILNNLSSN